ncbi:hypothetical protein EWB00_008593 [Schistosoma japonicum]|uniref:Uncharacterized protein n=1 Tax=Schistosoma japonicum TaxID=6182 RepID=A0A4Z2CP78_SCHJA|nr:hypothetical protein EWB00_008593 [Schistosoma japonicum]
MTTGAPKMFNSFKQWSTNFGKNAILQYGIELIDSTIKNDLVPQLLLEALKEIYQDISSDLSHVDTFAFDQILRIDPCVTWKMKSTKYDGNYSELKYGTTQHIIPKVIASEFNKVIHPEEFSRTNDFRKSILQNLDETNNIRIKVWCTTLADKAVKNALAFDILENILLGIMKFAVPRVVKFTMGEEFAFTIVFESTVNETINELIRNECNIQYNILRLNQLKMIDKVARKKPGDVLISMSIDSLLSLSIPGPITGTYTNNPIEEKLLKTLVCDVLLNRVCTINETAKKVGECLPLCTYHDMINEDIFFTEVLGMLKHHIENDLEDIDLTETHYEIKSVI